MVFRMSFNGVVGWLCFFLFILRVCGYRTTLLLPQEEFDYIIVGGGGSGCVVARTLAEHGYSVLVIERGLSKNETLLSQNIKGAGLVLSDRSVSQTLTTTQGILSHNAAILGGGTAINFGIWIEETAEYFKVVSTDVKDALLANYGDKMDEHALINNATASLEAYEWLRKNLNVKAQPKTDSPYYKELRKAVSATYGEEVLPPSLSINKSWQPYTMLSEHNRISSDDLLKNTGDNLVVVLAAHVDKIEFSGNRAICVLVSSTKYENVRRKGETQGGRASVTPNVVDMEFSSNQYESVSDSTYSYNPTSIYRRFPPLYTSRRVCIKVQNHLSEIILAAGAIETPLLLMRSGIGPAADLNALGVFSPVVVNEAVGKNLMDRPLVPLTFFSQFPSLEHSVVAEVAALKMLPSGLMAGFEELSGGRLVEGFIAATRLMLPVGLRSSAVGDLFERVIDKCSDIFWNSPNSVPDLGLNPARLNGSDAEFRQPPHPAGVADELELLWRALVQSDDPQNSKILFDFELPRFCDIYKPVSGCIEQQLGWITFVADVRSRGSISIDPWSRQPRINANYFGDSHDMETMKVAVQTLIQTAKLFDDSDILISDRSNKYLSSCPAPTLRDAFHQMEEIMLRAPLSTASNAPLSKASSECSERPWPAPLKCASNNNPEIPRPELYLDSASIMNILGSPVDSGVLKLTTFPPYVPDPGDEQALENFIVNYCTSMWHWAGSASLGSVLDEHFRVIGTSNLRVIDSSSVPRLPRMNPSATILAFARVATLDLLDERVKSEIYLSEFSSSI